MYNVLVDAQFDMDEYVVDSEIRPMLEGITDRDRERAREATRELDAKRP